MPREEVEGSLPSPRGQSTGSALLSMLSGCALFEVDEKFMEGITIEIIWHNEISNTRAGLQSILCLA